MQIPAGCLPAALATAATFLSFCVGLSCDGGHVRSWFDDCPSSLALLFDVLAVISKAPGTA